MEPSSEAPTTVREPVQEPAAPAAAPVAEPAPCTRCGAPLRADQEWCLNCGAAAGTRVAPPSGWKVPVAIVATVLSLALAGLIVAFLAVSDDEDELGRVAQSQPTPAAGTPAPAPPPPAPTPAPTSTTPPTGTTPAVPPATAGEQPPAGDPAAGDDSATAPGEVASWPAGKRGYTVVLASTTSRDAADKRAESEAAGGTEVGVLDSDEFSSLRGGYFVVFSGVYDRENEAEAALEALGDADGAYIRRITPR